MPDETPSDALGGASFTAASSETVVTVTSKESIKEDVGGAFGKVESFLDEIMDELGKGNRLEFRDFGVFESKIRAARIAQNPKTLERVQVPEKRTVKFKVGRIMKIKLSQEVSDFESGHPPMSVSG